jgi:hypothetical protein
VNARPKDLSQAQRAQILEALLARFSWPVEEEYMRESFEVVTDPGREKHTVFWPRESLRAGPSFGRYLHEMGHALLAETVHPQFSRPAFAKGADPALANTYGPAMDAVLDWFVQGLLMEIAPGPQGADIDERFRTASAMLRRGEAPPSVEFVVDTALALASFQHFRGLDARVGGKLAVVAGAFLRTPPEKPTLFGLQSLTRSVVEAFERHTAALVREKGFTRWRIKPLKKG